TASRAGASARPPLSGRFCRRCGWAVGSDVAMSGAAQSDVFAALMEAAIRSGEDTGSLPPLCEFPEAPDEGQLRPEPVAHVWQGGSSRRALGV
ncbi:MAG: hypothetical protein MI892_13405, partial [Desulfobacterales bacterium]|nr:hypothetical protein [Desulfobacterales bacterium]